MPSEDFVGHLVDLELDALLVLLVQDARQVDSYLLSEILGAHSFLTRSFCYFTPIHLRLFVHLHMCAHLLLFRSA